MDEQEIDRCLAHLCYQQLSLSSFTNIDVMNQVSDVTAMDAKSRYAAEVDEADAAIVHVVAVEVEATASAGGDEREGAKHRGSEAGGENCGAAARAQDVDTTRCPAGEMRWSVRPSVLSRRAEDALA